MIILLTCKSKKEHDKLEIQRMFYEKQIVDYNKQIEDQKVDYNKQIELLQQEVSLF